VSSSGVTSLRKTRLRSGNASVTPRVGLFGLLGQGNLGNDGSVEAIVSYLRAEHPDAILDFMCTGPDQMTAQYGVPAVRLRWYNPQHRRAPGIMALVGKSLKAALGPAIDAFRTTSWVRRHDVVIVPGMGMLEASLPLRAWHTPYSMFLLSASGRVFGTKIALVSVGADVIDQRIIRWLLMAAARLAHYRSYRDVLSRDAMQRMGVNVSDDAVYPDLAFSLPTPAGDAAVPGAVGVGVIDFVGGNRDRDRADEVRAAYVGKMERFVLWLADNGRPVRLFTTDVHDEPIMHEIIRRVRALRPALVPGQIVAQPVSSLCEIMQHMTAVDTVVASRYHNVLCALKVAKPTVAVGYAAKFGALMADMGLEEFCQSARSLEVDQLIDQFTKLESRSGELQQSMTERNELNRRLLDRQFAALSALFFRPPGESATARAPRKVPSKAAARKEQAGTGEP
jgi:polysaccharide pyruvyl transferase WcaK-like protein